MQHRVKVSSGLCRGLRSWESLIHLGQGKSGKLSMVWGKLTFPWCRSGEEFTFSSSKIYLDFFNLNFTFFLFLS